MPAVAWYIPGRAEEKLQRDLAPNFLSEYQSAP